MPKVCCPPQSSFEKFNPNPVIFPDSSTKPKVTEPEQKPEPILKPTKTTDNLLLPLKIDPSNNGDNLGPRQFEAQPNRVNKDFECGTDKSSSNKINGGTETDIDEYPWLAILQYSQDLLLCGGSLIRPKFVLTAAHCILSKNGKPKKVRLAEYDLRSFPTDTVEVDGGGFEELTVTIIDIVDTFTYLQYNRIDNINDIGLVKLAEDAPFSDFIRLICLPKVNFMPEFNSKTNFTLAGWGTNNMSQPIDVKSAIVLPFMPKNECERVYDNILDTQICAGGEIYKDSCKGDSGGPLMFLKNQIFYVIGIVSYGRITCGTDGAPAVHTYVYDYLPWINNIVDGSNT